MNPLGAYFINQSHNPMTAVHRLRRSFNFDFSLRSKRFRLVSEKKNQGTGFSVLIAREMKREPKK